MAEQSDSIFQFLQTQVFPYLKKIIDHGGGWAAVFSAVIWVFATKWLDSRYAKKIEAFKKDQDRELREIEFNLNSLFDRRKRIHDKEYQVLPEAWVKLNEAYWKSITALPGFRSYPDLESMPEDTFREFVASISLSDWEKRELLSTPNRNKYYQDRHSENTLHAAKEASKDCHAYLLKNGIFLLPDLKEKFRKIDDLIWNALVTYETNRGHTKMGIAPSQSVSSSALEKEVDALLADLEAIVQGRLNE